LSLSLDQDLLAIYRHPAASASTLKTHAIQ
jgi:hypothetical protein